MDSVYPFYSAVLFATFGHTHYLFERIMGKLSVKPFTRSFVTLRLKFNFDKAKTSVEFIRSCAISVYEGFGWKKRGC